MKEAVEEARIARAGEAAAIERETAALMGADKVISNYNGMDVCKSIAWYTTLEAELAKAQVKKLFIQVSHDQTLWWSWAEYRRG